MGKLYGACIKGIMSSKSWYCKCWCVWAKATSSYSVLYVLHR